MLVTSWPLPLPSQSACMDLNRDIESSICSKLQLRLYSFYRRLFKSSLWYTPLCSQNQQVGRSLTFQNMIGIFAVVSPGLFESLSYFYLLFRTWASTCTSLNFPRFHETLIKIAIVSLQLSHLISHLICEWFGIWKKFWAAILSLYGTILLLPWSQWGIFFSFSDDYLDQLSFQHNGYQEKNSASNDGCLNDCNKSIKFPTWKSFQSVFQTNNMTVSDLSHPSEYCFRVTAHRKWVPNEIAFGFQKQLLTVTINVYGFSKAGFK